MDEGTGPASFLRLPSPLIQQPLELFPKARRHLIFGLVVQAIGYTKCLFKMMRQKKMMQTLLIQLVKMTMIPTMRALSLLPLRIKLPRTMLSLRKLSNLKMGDLQYQRYRRAKDKPERGLGKGKGKGNARRSPKWSRL